MAIQSNYRVTANLGGIDLAVTQFKLEEALSQPFHFELDVVESVYTDQPVRDAALIDKQAHITLWEGDTVKRRLHGIIDRVVEKSEGARYRAYTVHAGPMLDRLGLTANCRIFQLKTVDEIIREVLKQHDIVFVSFNLDNTKARREYCVQYNETDLDFIQRLTAEEGLIYWFEHEEDLHKLQFVDQIDSLPDLPGSYRVRAENASKTEASIWSFTYEERRVTARSAQRDYTFKNPRYTLAHEHHGLHTQNQDQSYEHYSYNGRYKTDKQGKPFVQYRQEARQSAQRVAVLESDHLHFAAGRSIDIEGVSERHDHAWQTISNTLVMHQPQALEEAAVVTGNASG